MVGDGVLMIKGKSIVDDKIEFTAYCGSAVCGIYSLIGKDPVDELQIGEN